MYMFFSKDFNKIKNFLPLNIYLNQRNLKIVFKSFFTIINKNIDEYNLDYPSAKSNLQKLLDYTINQKIIKSDFYKDLIAMFSLKISVDLG